MKCMLTTFDNPYNPYDNLVEWQIRDSELGYNTAIKLNEIIELFCDQPYEELTEAEQDSVRETAIDFIIINDPLNIYKKVKPS